MAAKLASSLSSSSTTTTSGAAAGVTSSSTSMNDTFIKNGLSAKSRQIYKQTLAAQITRSQSPPRHTHHIKFHVGNLVWAKLDNHPWWPCKITREFPLDSNSSYVKLISKYMTF